MFVLGASDSFWWPVVLEIPAAEGGTLEKHDFQILFARLSQPKIKEIILSIQKGETDDRKVCDQIVLGWRDIVGKDKKPLDFTPENRDLVFTAPLLMQAVIRAWFDAHKGGARKNS